MIAVLLVLATTAPPTAWASEPDESHGYRPLTEAEADAWLRSVSYEELIRFVIRYDYVEHAEPEFGLPGFSAVVLEEDVVVWPEGPARLAIGHLEYRVELPDLRFEGAAPEQERFSAWRPAAWGVAGGFVLGVVATATLTVRMMR